MPIHDWTRVDAGLFHAFHHRWIDSISDALNDGTLPPDYYALPEQTTGGYVPDVLTLKLTDGADDSQESNEGGLAVATAPPKTAVVSTVEEELYAKKANHIAIHHRHGNVVAVIEIVSPGNKASKAPFAAFVKKSVDLIQNRIHLLVIDLFPPGPRDPLGIHKPIWDEFREESFSFPPGKSLLLASYDAGPPWTAYIEPIGVGDLLTDMPIFLRPQTYIPAPLEATYQIAWKNFPRALKGLLE